MAVRDDGQLGRFVIKCLNPFLSFRFLFFFVLSFRYFFSAPLRCRNIREFL